MRKGSRKMAGVIVAAVVVCVAAPSALAETFPLELKRLESLTPSPSGSPAGYIYRMVRPQRFFMQTGVQTSQAGVLVFGARPSGPSADFSKVVTKEPASYNSDHPFRGVATLASGKYGFVFDSQESKSTDYDRLYFDVNHNGDLTDDPPVDGRQPPGRLAGGTSRWEFPRVDLTLDADGTKLDYAFFFSVYSSVMVPGRVQGFFSVREPTQPAEPEQPQEPKKLMFVSASLVAAAYREGEITLNGKSRRVVLLDHNSNGRFDDKVTIRKSSSGMASPVYGDVLLVDPDPNLRSSPNLLSSQVAKLARIDGSLYDLNVTPAGDQLALTPSSTPVGRVALGTDGLRATVYGDLGIVEVSGDKFESVTLPAGDWNLMSYTIDLTGRWQPAEAEQEKPKESSLLRTLADSLTGSVGASAPKSGTTRILAYGTSDSKVIKFGGQQTVAFPFGPPYRPVVKAAPPLRAGQQTQLAMSLLGSGGELCRSLSVNGGRPQPPQFTIRTPGGEEIESGKFKWG